MWRVTTLRMTDQPGVRYAAACASLFVLTGVLVVADLRGPVAVVLYLVISLEFGTRLSTLPALALGAATWAFYTGFEVNQDGQLTLTGSDAWRLLLFSVATIAASVMAPAGTRRIGYGSIDAQ